MNNISLVFHIIKKTPTQPHRSLFYSSVIADAQYKDLFIYRYHYNIIYIVVDFYTYPLIYIYKYNFININIIINYYISLWIIIIM